MLRGLTRSNSSRSATFVPGSDLTSVLNADTDDYVVAVKGGFTGRLALAWFACVIGSSFQVGYNLGVINMPQRIIEEFINTSYHNQSDEWLSVPADGASSLLTWLWSITVAIFCIGGMIGGLSAGYFADKFGRKGALLLNNIILFVGVGLSVVSIPINVFELLIGARFILGINCGMNSGLGPLYLSETSPLALRGLAGTLNQLTLVIGILISQVLGLRNVFGTDVPELMILFGLSAAPAVLGLVLMPLCPESPLHLVINKSKVEQAKTALITLRGSPDVNNELDLILQEKESLKHVAKVKMSDLFRFSALRKPLVIALVIQCSQQLSGINAIIFYSTKIFSSFLAHEVAQYLTLGTSGVNVVMTFVAAMIMDRAGRRTLHLGGLIVMLLAGVLFTLGLQFSVNPLSVAGIMLFIVGFGIGPGSIPWFITAELFETGPRPGALSLAVLVNWFTNFLVGLVFPLMQASLKNFVFLPFIGLLVLFVIFTYLKLPETKNRSIEEISRQFRDDGTYVIMAD